MTLSRPLLWQAYLLSLLLHALFFVHDLPIFGQPIPPPRPVLAARLQALPPVAAPEPVELFVPDPAASSASESQPTATPPLQTSKTASLQWKQVVDQQLKKLQAAGLYYSQEAIGLGLQGEVLVLFVLDEAGHVTAARVQESSGHALLDRDAVAVALRLTALPADAPREGLLLLRFRLQ